MKNRPIVNNLANPFGITSNLIIGIAMLMSAISRFLSNDLLLGSASLIGSCGFAGISVYLILLFKKTKKK